MNVYLVYSGRYDDHGLDAVFSTKELAQEYIDQGKTSYPDVPYILEQEVDNPPIREEESQLPFFTVRYFYEEDRWETDEHIDNLYDTYRVEKIAATFYCTTHYRITYQAETAEDALENGKMDILQAIEEGSLND